MQVMRAFERRFAPAPTRCAQRRDADVCGDRVGSAVNLEQRNRAELKIAAPAQQQVTESTGQERQ